MKKYTPIDCNQYDHLEIWALQKQLCKITYLNEGERIAVHTTIKTIETINKEEFLILNDGSKIRLDWIVKINDITFGGNCKIDN